MARAITGYVEWRGGQWKVLATEPDGSRKWRDLDARIPRDRPDLARAVGTKIARAVKSGEVVPEERDTTVSEWYRRWFGWRKGRGWTDADKLQGQFAKHLEGDIGHLPMRDGCIRRDHFKAFVVKLDDLVKSGAMSWKTARNLWSQIVSKPMKDATDGKESSLCVLSENPAAGVQPPDRGARTKKQYLYPDEAVALLSCAEVPLWRRRLYAFAIYTYMRAGEIAALQWEDVDIKRGVIVVHRALNRNVPKAKAKATKTDEERRVVIEPALRPMLEALEAEATTASVFPTMPPAHGKDGQAPTLRADLEVAGVTRAALLKRARTRKRMTFHDLRATGITWAAIRGDDALKIMSRSGHSEYQTMMAYVREAEVLRDGFGDVFPALPEVLIESPKKRPTAQETDQKARKNSVPKGIRIDGPEAANRPEKQASDANIEEPKRPFASVGEGASTDDGTPRTRALADLYRQAIALTLADDHEGARLLHDAAGKLLALIQPARTDAKADVVDLATERERRK